MMEFRVVEHYYNVQIVGFTSKGNFYEENIWPHGYRLFKGLRQCLNESRKLVMKLMRKSTQVNVSRVGINSSTNDSKSFVIKFNFKGRFNTPPQQQKQPKN